jgi:hypothetical protein
MRAGVIGSFHQELEKVKFTEFLGAPEGAAAEAWLERMACASHFAVLPPT